MTVTTTPINANDISVQLHPADAFSSNFSPYILLGTVSAVGSLVSDLALADQVAIHVPTATGRACGHCRWCLKGQDDMCTTTRANACDLISGQAAVVPAKSVFKVSGSSSVSAATLEAAASVYAPLREHMMLGARIGIVSVGDNKKTVGVQKQLASSFAHVLGAGQVSTDSIEAGSTDLLLVLLESASVPANVAWEELIGKVGVGGRVVIVGAQGADGQGQGLGIKLNLGAVISGQRSAAGSTWKVARGKVEEMVRFAENIGVELTL